jgi:hypothetical protein
MHLMMANGSYKELPLAESAEIEGDDLVLRDAAGAIVETLGRMTVTAFGAAVGAFFASVLDSADSAPAS